MKPKIYIETTIISYLTARRTKDELRNGQIKLTQDWWKSAPDSFDLYASDLVIAEASAGDPQAAAERLRILSLPTLQSSIAAENLAKELLKQMALPPKEQRDALHVGIAATNGMDYLLTWNCRHLANASLRPRIERVCLSVGFIAPIIATPQELREVWP